MTKVTRTSYQLLDGSVFEAKPARSGRAVIVRFIDGSVLRLDAKGNEIKPKAKKYRSKTDRNIIINYWGASGAGTPLKSNRAQNPDTAIDRAFMHMRRNDYEAFVAEVFNEMTGELLAVITHSVVGEIRTMFHYDNKNKVYVQNFDEVAEHQAKLAVEEAKRQEAAALAAMDQISRIMTLSTN